MCMKELLHKHKNHQTLADTIYKMRVKEADLVKTICESEVRNDTLEENLCHIYEKINWMYEHMNKVSENNEEKWAEHKLMMENMHHVTS